MSQWPIEVFDEIARDTLSLFDKVVKAQICHEGSEHIYFEILSEVLGEAKERPSPADLSKALRSMQIDAEQEAIQHIETLDPHLQGFIDIAFSDSPKKTK